MSSLTILESFEEIYVIHYISRKRSKLDNMEPFIHHPINQMKKDREVEELGAFTILDMFSSNLDNHI